jgi:hypothetical protein
MAPKHHPELGKARAMTTVLAQRSAELRTKGETLIRQADKLLAESWNEKMWAEGEPIDPSPTIDQAINGGYVLAQLRSVRVLLS